MAQLFRIHPENPQLHLVRQTCTIVQQGGVIVYPTDSAYALGCGIGQTNAIKRMRTIRQLDEAHNFTLMCRDLSELSTYARVSNPIFRLLKAFTPGPYTFILPATREVPRRFQHPKRKTIGIRVPAHKTALTILEALNAPLISTTLILPNAELPLIEPEAMRELLGKQVDLIIDGGYCGVEQTTIVDLTSEEPKIIREGKGDIAKFLTEA